MPVDEEGNVADIIMDGGATINRMNIGRLYEQYFNTASRHTHNLVCKMLNIAPYTNEMVALEHIAIQDPGKVNETFELLCGYYRLLNEKMYEMAMSSDEPRTEYLAYIVAHGIGIYLPPDNPKESVQMLKDVEGSIYRPHHGKVTYIGNSGKRVTTEDNIRIGGMYIILLEKTGDDWSSVSSAKLQHTGIIAPLTKQDKYSNPARLQGVKGAGEAEVRIFKSYTKGNFTVEMMDRNNNPKTHKHICATLLTVPNPTNIDKLVNRTQIPFGGVKPLMLIRHITECAGFRFRYRTFDAALPSGMIDDGETD